MRNSSLLSNNSLHGIFNQFRVRLTGWFTLATINGTGSSRVKSASDWARNSDHLTTMDGNTFKMTRGDVTLSGLGNKENFECAKVIVEHGVNVHIGGLSGLNPFDRVTARRNLKLTEFMLVHGGADINHFYSDQHPSILLIVTEWGHEKTVETVLRYDVDLTPKNELGQTVLYVARSMQHHGIIVALENTIQGERHISPSVLVIGSWYIELRAL
ncbi:hypothetical protein F4776DRAFT_411250 [Hypoxylon sp. NC0597]|nr:hypothetical protein F4776DRAFT_411250 [Hypoxylon sp. NC0597]